MTPLLEIFLNLQVRSSKITLRFDQAYFTEQERHKLIPVLEDTNQLRFGMIDTTIMTVNAEGNAEDDSANSIVDQFVKAFEEKRKLISGH